MISLKQKQNVHSYKIEYEIYGKCKKKIILKKTFFSLAKKKNGVTYT